MLKSDPIINYYETGGIFQAILPDNSGTINKINL